MKKPENDLTLAQSIIQQALKQGADSADVFVAESHTLSVGWRSGKLESLERAESSDINLRVFIGKKQAFVSSSDPRPENLSSLVGRAVSMARQAPEDIYCGLADPADISKSWPEIQIADDSDLSAENLIARAKEAEESALAVKGVSMCDSADASCGNHQITLVASNGFAGQYRRTGYSLSCSALSGEGTDMQTDYDFAHAVFESDLDSAEVVGRTAGERAVRKQGARKMPTAQWPVVMEPRTATSLLGHLAGAISGASIARGTSFLKDKLDQQIFAKGVTVVDDPYRPRGLGSRLFDADGLAPNQRLIVDQGLLTTWLLDLRSARQLGLKSTAHASRAGGPSPSNFYFAAGLVGQAELIKDIKQGFYVTDLMGSGVNGVTGDYSRAASGFWIENGQIAFPVNEMTIAGNLKDMFLNLTPANDLTFKFGYDSPTIRIDGMTIAGI